MDEHREKRIQSMIERAGLIREKYDTQINENKFNLFSILRNDYEEVGLHSNFIYELLNPEGSHQKGDTFFKLFNSVIGSHQKGDTFFKLFNSVIGIKGDFNEKSLKVRREFGIPSGRLDIICEVKQKNEDKPFAIIIENKIGSGEGSGQLDKYKEYAKSQYGEDNFILLFLTLYEEEIEGKEDEDNRVVCIKYESHIVDWLNRCIKEAALQPLVRETIKMYKNLVLKLTGQSYSEEMTNDMIELIRKNSENFRNAMEIEQNVKKAVIEIQKSLWENMEAALGSILENFPGEQKELFNHWWSDGRVDNFNGLRNRDRFYGIIIPIYKFHDYILTYEITIDHRIYYCLCLYKKQNEGPEQIRLDFEKELSEAGEIGDWYKRFLDEHVGESRNSDWKSWSFSYYRYPTSEKQTKYLNFRSYNSYEEEKEEIIKLADEKYMEELTKKMADDIVEEIGVIVKKLEPLNGEVRYNS